MRENTKTSMLFGGFMSLIAPLIITIPVTLLFSPISQILSLSSKKSELFADSFSTAYGYGSELITALEKMGNNKKYYNPKSKASKFLYDLGRCQYEAFGAILEPHGSNQERCKECLKKLKKDLKTSDFSPELREELENEIKRVETEYYKILNMTGEEKSTATRIWRKLNHVIFRDSPNLISKLFKTNKV